MCKRFQKRVETETFSLGRNDAFFDSNRSLRFPLLARLPSPHLWRYFLRLAVVPHFGKYHRSGECFASVR